MEISTTSATSGAGTSYPSKAPEFIPVLCALFVLFLMSIALSVLVQFMGSDYPFGIVKRFLQW
jgi:hypothetical protein